MGALQQGYEVATLAGGCFWCLEAVYDGLRGVVSARSGYTGGTLPDPTYKQVCGGDSGHAEAVRVTFDPQVVSYREILDVFFTIHDPTTVNRQGNDVGSQYRSAIFYDGPQQRAVAQEVISDLAAKKLWHAPIVTELQPAGTFYEAEDYHQDYFANNAGQPYCQLIVAPKVAKFRKRFLDKLKA
jgi:peptide-methionine (S)-S-oxide reductase